MKAIFDKNCKCVGWYNENDGMVGYYRVVRGDCKWDFCG